MFAFANSLKLIEWLIRLLSYKERQRAALFKDLVEPLFTDLQAAYMEYVKALTEIKVTLHTEMPLSEVAQRAQKLRDETALLRHKCAAIANSYGQTLTGNSAAIDDFLAGAPSIFSSTFEGSYFFDLIDLINRATSQVRFLQCADERRERSLLLSLVEEMLATGDRNWRSICGEYGRLRSIYCQPISIFAGQGKQYAETPLHLRGQASVFERRTQHHALNQRPDTR